MKLPDHNGFRILLTKCAGFILLFLAQINPLLYSQLPVNDTLRVKGNGFNEELYIITDRDLYAAGEKVWLKIHKLNGLTHAPVNLSKVAYVDLLDMDNNPVIELKTNIEGFSGSADFRLPDTLRTGNYLVRSYTNWMQNFSKDLFAYRIISVINPFDKFDNIKVPSRQQSADSVNFYPEGGRLVAGIESEIGFRSFHKNGEPAFLKGALVDENNDTLCHVQTDDNGYGWAMLKPSHQKKIFLVTLNNYDPHRRFQLPSVQDEGIILSVVPKREGSDVLAKIKISPGYNPSGHNLFLALHSAGFTGIKKEIRAEKDHEINILRNDLPYGLSQLVIVDKMENALTDRWIYNDKNELIKYTIQLQKSAYASREKIKLEISATDNKGAPVESDFSLSVAKAVTANRHSFKNNNYRQLPQLAPLNTNGKLTDMNDYLIFYGSHALRLSREENSNMNSQGYLPELEGHLICGRMSDRKTGEPLKNENISLSFVGKVALCLFSKTDGNGNFNFVTREQGLSEIVIQPISSETRDCYVELHNPFSIIYNNYEHGLLNLDTSRISEINKVIIGMQICNIYEPYFHPTTNSLAGKGIPDFYGNPDKTVQMSRFIELTSTKEILKELVPEISVIKNKDKINFRLNNQYQFERSGNGLLVLVDGVPMVDLEKVLGIRSTAIEKADVLFVRYFISGNVFDGILHFVTKSGDLDAIEMDKSIFRQEYEFVQHPNEFYSPDYSVDSLKYDHLPDFRNTLFWNPDLHTDKSGRATVEFYSSDESAEFSINVEGITPEGKTGATTMPLIIKGR
jgi:hypothetical protein